MVIQAHTHRQTHTCTYSTADTLNHSSVVEWQDTAKFWFSRSSCDITTRAGQKLCVCTCVGGGATTQSPHQFHTQHTHIRLYPLQSLHHSINESFHQFINASLHHSINASFHHSIIPSLHHSITPSIHQCIIPSLHQSLLRPHT